MHVSSSEESAFRYLHEARFARLSLMGDVKAVLCILDVIYIPAWPMAPNTFNAQWSLLLFHHLPGQTDPTSSLLRG